MTTPQRSTRRSVNPPEGEKTPEQGKDHTHNLAEVESILDEIENLVSKKNKDKEETAVSTQVLEEQDHEKMDQTNTAKDPETDIGRLEEELHSAIASELQKSPESIDIKSRDVVSEEGIPQGEIDKLAEVFEEAEANRSKSDELGDLERSMTQETTPGDDEPSESSNPEKERGESKILKVLSRPMQGLSPTMRVAVNIIAITLALWVPIIWLLVLSGGFSSPVTDGAPAITPEVVVESIPEPRS